MEDFTAALATALALIVRFDRDLVAMRLPVIAGQHGGSESGGGVRSAAGSGGGGTAGFLDGTLVGALLNAMMGLPPVVVGLALYVLLSRAGPLGELGLLYTPTAMVLAQCVLVTPIIAALTRQTIADLHEEYDEQLRSLGVGPWRTIGTLLWDGRFSLLTAMMAGFGRASAEVGAVIIVGGNINHVTRVMTTTIALETSKGDLPLALGLGIILLLLTFMLNAAALAIRDVAKRAYG